jgi:hypothetical protein
MDARGGISSSVRRLEKGGGYTVEDSDLRFSAIVASYCLRVPFCESLNDMIFFSSTFPQRSANLRGSITRWPEVVNIG